MTDGTFVEMGKQTNTIEQCTSSLRWMNGVLQQAWKVMEVDEQRVITAGEFVWRDVPICMEPATGATS